MITWDVERSKELMDELSKFMNETDILLYIHFKTGSNPEDSRFSLIQLGFSTSVGATTISIGKWWVFIPSILRLGYFLLRTYQTFCLPMMHKSKPLVAKVDKTVYANEVSLTDQPSKFLKHIWIHFLQLYISYVHNLRTLFKTTQSRVKKNCADG